MSNFYDGVRSLKIQQEIMKNGEKRLNNSTSATIHWFTVNFTNSEDFVNVSEGHFIVCIPKSHFFLDRNNDYLFPRKPADGKLTMSGAYKSDVSEVRDTHIVEVLSDGKALHKFEGKDEDIYINEAYLKNYFNLKADLKFYGTDRKSPVYIWQNGDLIGVVLPVNRGNVERRS